MRTLLPPYWSNPDLTGNSTMFQYEDVDVVHTYVVSNVHPSTNSFSILHSIDHGATFTEVATYTFSISNPKFDPAIHYDVDNAKIIIVGTEYQSSQVHPTVVSLFSYTIGGSEILYFGKLAESLYTTTYDVGKNNTGAYVVVITPTLKESTSDITLPIAGETYQFLTAVELTLTDNTLAIVTPLTVIKGNQPLAEGTTFGGVSLNQTSDGSLELFCSVHPTRQDPKESTLHFINRYLWTV